VHALDRARGGAAAAQEISTIGEPMTIEPPCAVMSPMRAAGRPPIKVMNEPITITSGGPTQTAMLVTQAAGRPLTSAIEPPGRIGPPTWGTRTVTIGQTCMSVTRAAGIPMAVLL